MFDPATASQLPLSEFVTIHVTLAGFKGSTTSRRNYLVHQSQVDEFVQATLKLHSSPGVNPHNGGATASLIELEVRALGASGPFWWTSSDLGVTGGENRGACIFDNNHGTTLHYRWNIGDDGVPFVRDNRPAVMKG